MDYVDIFWLIVKLITILTVLTSNLLWFLLPKKWILTSKNSVDVFPSSGIPPWWALNRLGKTIGVFFYGGFIAIFILMLIGYLLGY